MAIQNEKFLSAYHQSLTDDLNHISVEFMKAKWFFLATIGAAGIAYWSLHGNVNNDHPHLQDIGYFIICLTGNIIFWLISEYSLSHAFLFRNIQTRLVKIERQFDNPLMFNDPTKIDNFIYYDANDKKYRLSMEYIIPDQFVPIYWASTWLIIVNTFVSVYLQKNINFNEWKSLAYILISVPLIWKLWTYYCYKLDKFINENCTFKIFYKTIDKNNYYYRLSTFGMSFWGALIFTGIYWLIIFFNGTPLKWYPFLFFSVLGWFWPVYVGLLFHIFRLALQWQLHEEPAWLKKIFPHIFPEVNKIGSHRYIVNCNCWSRILYVLYNIS